MKHLCHFIFLALFASSAQAADIYFANSSAGGNTGANCANARAASGWTGSDWTAGNTLHLCGTIGYQLTAQGSGSVGNPVTVIWETGAKLSAPALANNTPWFIVDNRHDLVLDGGTNGIIEDTDNGSSLGHQVQSDGIRGLGAANLEVKNLHIQNLYVHSSVSDTFLSDNSVNCVYVDHPGTGFIKIHHNVMHDANWCLKIGTFSSANTVVTINNNEIYRIDHGLAYYGDGTNFKSTLVFHDNWIHDFANWDTTINAYHHDGIHTFTGDVDLTYYNNLFSGSMGGNNTSFVFQEGVAGGSNDSNNNSNQLWYNNIWIQDTVAPNWISNSLSFITGKAQFYNNTWICAPGTANPQEGLRYNFGSSYYSSIPQHLTFENNIVTGCSTLVEGINIIRDTLDNNAYSNHLGGGPNYWSWNTTSTATLAAWQATSGGDASASYAAISNLNSSGVPQAGSSAINAGANLTSLGITTLNSDRNGVARPSTGPWTAGAYAFGGAVPPPPPGPPPVQVKLPINILPLPATGPVPVLSKLSPTNTYKSAQGFSQDGKTFTAALTVTATGSNLCATCFTFDGAPTMASCMTPNACTLMFNATTSIGTHMIGITSNVAPTPVLQ